MKAAARSMTLDEIIAEVDAKFMQKHPEFRDRKIARGDDASRREWNELFARHALSLVSGIRDAENPA
jgi:hypothetical protein